MQERLYHTYVTPPAGVQRARPLEPSLKTREGLGGSGSIERMSSTMTFPIVRHRRLRQSAAIRGMVRETVITVDDFVQPIFVAYGSGVKNEISSMPGVY